MTKKNDKRLCWNCEGDVSHHISQCPFCGVDVTQPPPRDENSVFKGFGSPFQRAPNHEIPQPPYARGLSQDVNVTDDEWNAALNDEKPEAKEEAAPSSKRHMIALLLLLPGVVFFLFGLALTLFSTDGILTLQWNQNVAYFYFLGSIPLLYLGWRAFR